MNRYEEVDYLSWMAMIIRARGVWHARLALIGARRGRKLDRCDLLSYRRGRSSKGALASFFEGW